jgi:branched-chain amino acid transport system ATP-binding protein
MYLSVKDLTISFGGLTAVEDLSFELEKGRIVSIIGPNGAGKTTTFNLVTGFKKPDRGSIVFQDQELVGLAPYKVAQKGVTRTFQKTNVFPNVTVLEAVAMGRYRQIQNSFFDILTASKKYRRTEHETRTKGLEILDFLGLAKRKDVQAKSLSYGELRLLEIAIALAAEPDLLLLDEPAAGMNPSEAERVMGIISRINEQGLTVLLVEHNMDVVMNISDHIVVLDHGRKICQGPPSLVQEDECVLEAYLGRGFLDAKD